MGFVRSLQEIAKIHTKSMEFYDAEMLTVMCVTTPSVPQRLLPPPLKPTAMPLAIVIVANYPRTNANIIYRESALFLQADFNGETGLYCLAMAVTDDMALIFGREVFGYPKKMAAIRLRRQGTEVEGWTERHGVRLLDVRAKLTGRFNDEVFQGIMKDRLQRQVDAVVYNHKYFPAPSGKGLDYNPRLVREVVTFSRDSLEIGEAEVVLRSSDGDPWGEVEIAKVLGAHYTVGKNTMLPGEIVAEIDQDEFAPYAFMKVDGFSL